MLKTEWMTQSFNDSVIHSVLGIKWILITQSSSYWLLGINLLLWISLNMLWISLRDDSVCNFDNLHPLHMCVGEIQHWVAWPGGASRVNHRCDRESMRDRLKLCVTRRNCVSWEVCLSHLSYFVASTHPPNLSLFPLLLNLLSPPPPPPPPPSLSPLVVWGMRWLIQLCEYRLCVFSHRDKQCLWYTRLARHHVAWRIVITQVSPWVIAHKLTPLLALSKTVVMHRSWNMRI